MAFRRESISLSLIISAFTGVIWSFLEQLARKGLAALSAIVLTYFVLPEEFGLLAIVSIAVALLGSLMEAGIKDSLIRRRFRSQETLDSAFFAAVVVGIICYGLLFLAAPWLADYFSEPRLKELLRFGGIVLITNSVQIVPMAELIAGLHFRRVFQATVPAGLISISIAIGLAYLGYGVWALVGQLVAFSISAAAIVFFVSSYRPKKFRGFSRARSLFRFGSKLFLAGLISMAVKGATPALVTKKLGAIFAGYYFFIDKIMEVVMGQLVYSIQSATYPALAAINNDKARLFSAFSNLLRVSALLIFPLLAILSALADPIFRFAFNDNWKDASQYFSIICWVYFLYPAHVINLNLLKVKGLSGLYLKLEVIKAIISFTVLLLSLDYGLLGVLLGQLLTSMICYLPNAYYSNRLVGYSMRTQLFDLLPYLIISVFSYLFSDYLYDAFLIIGLPSVISLIIAFFLSYIFSIALALIFRLHAALVVKDLVCRSIPKCRLI